MQIIRKPSNSCLWKNVKAIMIITISKHPPTKNCVILLFVTMLRCLMGCTMLMYRSILITVNVIKDIRNGRIVIFAINRSDKQFGEPSTRNSETAVKKTKA